MSVAAGHTPARGDGHRLLTRASHRKLALCAAIAIGVALAVLVLGREVEHHLSAIESWIASLGPWGVVAFVGLFAVGTSIFVPDTILCVLAGALFGLPWGLAAVGAGSLLGSTLQFALARRLLRAPIQRRLAARPLLAAIQRAVQRDELRLQVLLRLTPLNPATISYVLGAAGVRLVGFLVACLGLVPILSVEVYFGHAGRHMAGEVGAARGTAALHDAVMLGGLLMCVVVIVVVSRLARKAVMQAVAEEAANDADPVSSACAGSEGSER